jgi:hypothetical protein
VLGPGLGFLCFLFLLSAVPSSPAPSHSPSLLALPTLAVGKPLSGFCFPLSASLFASPLCLFTPFFPLFQLLFWLSLSRAFPPLSLHTPLHHVCLSVCVHRALPAALPFQPFPFYFSLPLPSITNFFPTVSLHPHLIAGYQFLARVTNASRVVLPEDSIPFLTFFVYSLFNRAGTHDIDS